MKPTSLRDQIKSLRQDIAITPPTDASLAASIKNMEMEVVIAEANLRITTLTLEKQSGYPYGWEWEAAAERIELVSAAHRGPHGIFGRAGSALNQLSSYYTDVSRLDTLKNKLRQYKDEKQKRNTAEKLDEGPPINTAPIAWSSFYDKHKVDFDDEESVKRKKLDEMTGTREYETVEHRQEWLVCRHCGSMNTVSQCKECGYQLVLSVAIESTPSESESEKQINEEQVERSEQESIPHSKVDAWLADNKLEFNGGPLSLIYRLLELARCYSFERQLEGDFAYLNRIMARVEAGILTPVEITLMFGYFGIPMPEKPAVDEPAPTKQLMTPSELKEAFKKNSTSYVPCLVGIHPNLCD